ncbi:MAG: MFS transporter [Coxiellaceae bacterium]|nr:MFS transporter [Coxiellaceae bacterium]
MSGVFKKARRHRMRIAWFVWFFAAIFVLFQFFLQLSSGVIIEAVMKSFALSAFGGGFLMSSYYYVYVLLQTPAGVLIDRYGPRWILGTGAVFVSMGCFLFATAKIVVFAFIGRILMGTGASFAFIGCMNVVSIWFPARRFAFMTAIVETAGMAGAISGNFWLAGVIHKIGWQRCLLAAAIFAAGLSFALFLFVRNAPGRKKNVKTPIFSATFLSGLKKLISNHLVWINGVYSGAMFSVVTVFIALWAIPFFKVAYHVNLWTASAVASALYVGIAVGGPFLGWLDSKTKWRRGLMIFNAFFAALCLGVVIADTQLSLVLVMCLLFLTGVCASSYVLTFAIANEIAGPLYRATSIGFTNMLCVAFAPLLQPLIGFLLTHTHHTAVGVYSVSQFQWAVSIVPLFLVISGCLALLLPSKQ